MYAIPIGVGKLEEKILALQEAKKDLADAVLPGDQTFLMTLSDEELMALL